LNLQQNQENHCYEFLASRESDVKRRRELKKRAEVEKKTRYIKYKKQQLQWK
jgi:hypothetical protein